MPKFTDVCLLSNNPLRLVDFYERLLGVQATERGEIHSSLPLAGFILTIDAAIVEEDSPFRYINGQNGSNAILGFDVEDVDLEYQNVTALGIPTLNQPTTHPWGARSFQFRDPDGNILNFRTRQ